MKLVLAYGVLTLLMGMMVLLHTAESPTHAANGICPTSTPPPPTMTWKELSITYDEWVPYPGTGVKGKKGWVRANDLLAIKNRAKHISTVNILQSYEYNIIARRYGLRIEVMGQEEYGFAPIQGFNTIYGGVVIKEEWLPKRLRR